MESLSFKHAIIEIADVATDDQRITITLTDGRTISAPLAWFPRLADATPAERQLGIMACAHSRALARHRRRYIGARVDGASVLAAPSAPSARS